MTDRIKDLIKDISRGFGIPMTPDEVELITRHSKIQKYKSRTQVLAMGDVCEYYYYVKKGLIREYFISDGQEKTIDIAIEGDVMCNMHSFYNHTPSKFIIETIEPTTLYCLSRGSITELKSSSVNISRFCFAFVSKVMQSMEACIVIQKTDKAKDRYQMLMDDYPEIVRRTPVKHLASLLQMRPETLSRIRKVCPDDPVWSAYLEREGKTLKERG